MWSIDRKFRISDGGLYKFISGCSTEPRPGHPDTIKFTDVLDQVSIDRVNHSSACTWCRRLWSTLQFRSTYSEDQVWAGLVAEFMKLLGATSIQST